MNENHFSKYIKIPLVGNKYQSRKPNKNDVDIELINEDDNVHDNMAVGVYSKMVTNNKITYEKLGFVIKDKTKFVREYGESLKLYKIVRSKEKNNDNLYYYYLLFHKP